MTGSSTDPTVLAGLAAPEPPAALSPVDRVAESLGQMADDPSLPRNVRRGAQAAKDQLARPRTPQDVRVAGALSVLDELANDSNLPTHGRTAIWSIMSHLESLQ